MPAPPAKEVVNVEEESGFCELRECQKQGKHGGHNGPYAVVPYAATEYPRSSGKGGCVSDSPHFATVQDAVAHRDRQNDRARESGRVRKFTPPTVDKKGAYGG